MAKSIRRRPTPVYKKWGNRTMRARSLTVKTNDAAAPYMSLVQKGLVSLQQADVFEDITVTGENGIIDPEHNYKLILGAAKANSALNQCIQAYVVNIESYGYQLEYSGAEGKEKKPLVQNELNRAISFLDNVSGDKTLRQIRETSRSDKEYLGDRYFEIGADQLGRPTFLGHVPTITLRRTKRDKKGTEYETAVKKPDGTIGKIKRSKKFCRYVQGGANGAKVFFKEYGDPRAIDPKTGKEVPGLAIENQATEIYCDSLYSPGCHYGTPRWIGALPDMLGIRESEIVNLNFFRENAIPAMALLISGGGLTEESYDKVVSLINSAKGKDAHNRFLILEAVSDDTMVGTDQAPPAPRLEMKALGEQRQSDAQWGEYQKEGKRKVRSTMRLPALYTGDCYSDDTYFLTENGWKLFDDVTDAKLATYNQDTGEIEYQSPTKTHDYEIDGDMISIKNKAIDLLVTPKHRMLARRYRVASRNPAPFTEMLAEDMHTFRGAMNNALQIPTAGMNDASDINSFMLAARALPMDSFVEFLGYFISEGSYGNSTQVRLSQNTGPVLRNMLDCVQRLGFKHSLFECNTRAGQFTITISDGELKNWLRKHVGHKSDDKGIPAFAKELSYRQTEVLFQALADGDGHFCDKGAEGSVSYCTTSQRLADDMQEVGVKNGFTVTRSLHDYEDGVRKLSFRLYVSARQEVMVRAGTHTSVVPYKGRIVCFTVPNSSLVVRRNGRVSIAMNTEEYTKATAQSGIRIAESQVFAPERSLFDEFVNGKLFPRLGITNWTFKSLGPPVYDPDTLSTMIDRFGRHGAMTPNILIKIANKVLDVQIPGVTDKWGDIPFTYTMGMVNAGLQIEGFEDIFATINDAATAGGTGNANANGNDPAPNAATAPDPANDNPQAKAVRRIIRQELVTMTDDIIDRINQERPE